MMHPFSRNIDSFKFNFLSRGQLGSYSIDVFKRVTGMSSSLVTLFLHLLFKRSEVALLT